MKEILDKLVNNPLEYIMKFFGIISLVGVMTTLFYPVYMSKINKEVFYSELPVEYWIILTIFIVLSVVLLSLSNLKKKRVKSVFEEKDSLKIIDEVYKKINAYIEKGGNNISIYDLNLQTTTIGDKEKDINERIYEGDKELVENLRKHNNITYKVLFGINSKKAKAKFNSNEGDFIEAWKYTTGFTSSENQKLYKLKIPDKEFPIPNIFLVPEFNILFIGMANYPSWTKKHGEEIKGGGILIENDENLCAGFKKICEKIIGEGAKEYE